MSNDPGNEIDPFVSDSPSDTNHYFVSDSPASSGSSQHFRTEPSYHDKTRRIVALTLVFLLAGVTAVALVAFIFGALSVDEIRELGIILTPVLTLTGTAVGFYFGSDQRG